MRVSGIKYIQGRNSYSPSQKYGIAIHNTSNDASAANEASYATRRPDGISAHLYADGVEVIQSLDTVNRAGHAGSTNGNYNAVAVEITGVNAKSRAWWIANVNWSQLGNALAQVCKFYGIAVRRASVSEMKSNPKVKAFYSHNDMRLAWGGTTHTDPGDNFPWDVLFAAVNAALGASTPTEGDAELNAAETQKLTDLWTWMALLVTDDDVREDDRFHFQNPFLDMGDNVKALVRENSELKAQVAALSAKLDALVIPAPEQNIIKLTVDGATVEVV